MSKESDGLLMMTDDQINYKELSNETLLELAQESDEYIANSALYELWDRKVPKMVDVARDILASTSDERGLEPIALKIMFESDRENAFAYMERHLHKADPYLFNTMAELILYYSDFRYELSVAKKITQRLKTGEVDTFLTDLADCKALEHLLNG